MDKAPISVVIPAGIEGTDYILKTQLRMPVYIVKQAFTAGGKSRLRFCRELQERITEAEFLFIFFILFSFFYFIIFNYDMDIGTAEAKGIHTRSPFLFLIPHHRIFQGDKI